ncbi:uncharacterized protein TNCV_2028971 [Trichonephila clavipes]|nr:uncharacterized protein TNCV_2028971 [Trichonephila clavipes]
MFLQRAYCGFSISVPNLRSSNLVFKSLACSSQGNIENNGIKKKDDWNFPEKSVSFYSCENIYEKWKKQRKFFRIPKSGIFANIHYVDTSEPKSNNDGIQPLTVMCIHGIPGNYGVFSHLIKALADKGVRVIVPNFPVCVALAVLSRQAVNRIYWSLFAVIARVRLCPGQLQTCRPVSWHRFQSYKVTSYLSNSVHYSSLCLPGFLSPDNTLSHIFL